MAINTTSTLTNAVRTAYVGEYLQAANFARVYDQYATPAKGMPMSELIRATTVQYNFLSDLAPATGTISQVADVTPVTFRDATTTITPTSRANAIQDAELLLIQAYTSYEKEQATKYQKVGKNNAESIDLLAQAAAVQGTQVMRAVARASLDAGTASHRLLDTNFAKAQAQFATLKVPGWLGSAGEMASPAWSATMHPYAFHDLRTSGQIDDIGNYQNQGIVLNYELGKIGPFRLIVTPWAKTFWGAGADNASSVDTTLNGAVNALAKTMVVTSATNIAVGMPLNIGTEETGDTHYETNERVFVTAINGTTITFVGEGDNGGLRFDHATGVAVRNADSVYTVTCGGPMSLACLYAESGLGEAGTVTEPIGRYGAIVGPHSDGILKQFVYLGWKYYGGYGRINDAWLLRQEVSTSFEG